jgi:hypothetical protein
MALMLGSTRVVRARILFTWKGVWTGDLDLDPDGDVTEASVPTGQQTLTVTTADGDVQTFVGTVDPQSVGRFVAGVKLRFRAGGGGWATRVDRQDFSGPSGVSSQTVEQATAGLVGETVNDPQPISLGLHWVRIAGPASRVFTSPDRDWYVDPSGVTQVGTWPVAQPDSSVEILDWDPNQQRATLSADAFVPPGTVLQDARFDGPITIRDAEHVWTPEGVRIHAWCSSIAVSRLTSALTNLVRELGGLAGLKSYDYVISQQDGQSLTLQAATYPDGTASEAPDLDDVVVSPGMAGLSASYLLGQHCRVVFLSARFSNPIVVSFDAQLPNDVTLDATGTTSLGPSGTVELAGGKNPVATVGSVGTVIFPPTPCPFTGTIGGVPIVGGLITITSPGLCIIQTGDPNVTAGPR